jgi:sec-independent protein translocase protein TatC
MPATETSKKSRYKDPEECAMSLGDHLEELRARLILAILGLLIGAIVSLAFGKHILRFIEHPYNAQVRKRIVDKRAPRMQEDVLAFVEVFFEELGKGLAGDPNASDGEPDSQAAATANAPATPPDLDPNQIAFFRRVSTNAVAAWTERMMEAAQTGPLPFNVRLRTLAPAEAFVAYMKIGLISGLILTCPWVFYQIWMFVAAGLYPHERHYVRTAVPFSAGLFVIGALFFLFVIAPLSLGFFMGFGDIVGVANDWTLQRYISFITVLMLVFGIAFQTPIAVFILVRTGLVGLPALRRARKYVLLGIVVVAAIATPPDVISQISLAIPLYGLFELGMVLAVIAEKKARESDRRFE